MRKRIPVIATLLLPLAVIAQEGSFHDLLREGQRFMENGQYDEAVEAMRQAQIENPEAEVVPYGIGAAYFEKGRQLAQTDPAAALEAFGAAQEAFSRLEDASDNALRNEAMMGKATAEAYMARLQDTQEQYREKVQGLRRAIQDLEQFTRQNPEHEQAQHNLDAARLELKQLLQAPPPPPPPQPQNAQSEEQEEDQQEQQQQQQQQQPGEQSEDEQEQQEDQEQGAASQEAGEEEQQQQQQQQQEEQDQEQQQQQQQQQPEEGDQQEEMQQQAEGGETGEEQETEAPSPAEPSEEQPDLENIEAILESLEDLDRREQRSIKQSPYAQDMRGAWW